MGNKFQNLPEAKYPRSYTPAMRRKIMQALPDDGDPKLRVFSPPPDLQNGEQRIAQRKPQAPAPKPKNGAFYGE